MSNNPYSTPQNSWNQQTHNPYAQSAQAHRANQQSQTASFGQPGSFRTPAHERPSQNTRRAQMKRGLLYAVGYVVLIWAVHIISTLIFGGALVYFGIHPLELSSLWHIFTSPILHLDFSHVLSNTVPGAIFAFLIGCSSHRVFWEVTAFVVLIGGLGTWLLGGPGTNHVGASMLVYGWLAYLLVRGIFNRSGAQIALGVVLGLMYSGLVWGVLPVDEGISWQAHLFGAIGGIAAGMLITSDDPPALRAKREAKKAEKLRSEQTAAPAAAAPQQQATPQPGPQNPGFSGNPPQSGPFYNPPRG